MGHEKAQKTCGNGMGPSKQLEVCIQKSTVRINDEAYVSNKYELKFLIADFDENINVSISLFV